MQSVTDSWRHPRAIGLLCAVAAVGLGIAHMRAAGAPMSYVAVNFAALLVGLAAALGNYPTPLVGYGGSAIVGYLLSLALLPAREAERAGGEP